MRLAFLVLLPLLWTAAAAWAQQPATQQPQVESQAPIYQYDPKYRKGPRPDSDEDEEVRVLANKDFTMSFVREPHLQPGEALLRLSTPVSIDGCVDVKSFEIKREEEPPYMRITMDKPELKLDESVRYDQIPCAAAGNFVFTDILLNREDLISRGINKLILRNDVASDVYDIQISDHKILLHTEDALAFKPQPGRFAGEDSLEFWFYPQNTVILSIPALRDSSGIENKIKDFAAEKDLIALNIAFPEFAPKKQETRFYFTDETGNTLKMIEGKTSVPLGNFEITRTYTGIKGPYEAKETVTVFAQKPGYSD